MGVLSMELASCHLSGAKTSEVAPKFWKNIRTLHRAAGV